MDSRRSSSSNRRDAGVASQAPASSLATSAETAVSLRGTQQPTSVDRVEPVEAPQPTNSASTLHAKLTSSCSRASRAQAEEQCAKAIEQTMTNLVKIEEAIAGAPNTKKDIKDSARSLGNSIRTMMKLLLTLDKVTSSFRDSVKSQQKQVQKQQQQQLEIRQQHKQTQEAIKKLQEAQAETSLLLQSQRGDTNETCAATANTPCHNLPSQVREILLDQGAKIDSLTKDLRALLQEQRQSPKQQIQQRKKLQHPQQMQDDQRQQQPPLPGAPPMPESTTVQRRRRRRTKESETKVTQDPDRQTSDKKRRRIHKTEATVLDKLAGNKSYADMIKEVKATVRETAMAFNITTRKSKKGKVILEVADKASADNLAVALREKFGEYNGVRRPTPSISLLLIGIEDSVDEEELGAALEAHDSELKTMNKLTIREGLSGVRTAIARVPLAPGIRLANIKKIRVGWAICRVK